MAGLNEYLIGGPSQKRVESRVSEPDLPPPMVGYRFMAVLVLTGALVVAAGYFRINAVFSVRDLEMEAGRQQELASKRRDRTKSLEARLSELRRSENLNEVAVTTLGMVPPDSATMETIRISPEARERWAKAAGEAPLIASAKEDDSREE